MRLLDKKQVQASDAAQRQIEIEQGIQLAKSVDALREAKNTEEANLEKFRLQTTARIRSEIDDLFSQKVAIKSDIDSLKEEKRLLGFIVDKEWEHLSGDERLEEIARLKSILDDKIFSLKDQENAIAEKVSHLKNEEQRIETEREQTTELLDKARIEKENSSRIAQEVKDRNIATLSTLERRQQEVLRKEIDVEAQKRDIDNRSASLDKKDKDLEIRERQLVDRYATLERTIQRYTEKRK